MSRLHKCSSVSEDRITCTVVICHPFQGETMATEGSLLWISPSGSIWIKSFSNVGVLCLRNTKHAKSFTRFCALGFSRFGHMPTRAIQAHPKQMGWEGERDGVSMRWCWYLETVDMWVDKPIDVPRPWESRMGLSLNSCPKAFQVYDVTPSL